MRDMFNFLSFSSNKKSNTFLNIPISLIFILKIFANLIELNNAIIKKFKIDTIRHLINFRKILKHKKYMMIAMTQTNNFLSK